jgi:hypothetical protein
VGAFIAAVHHSIVLSEEKHLRIVFGGTYEEYCRRVRRYLMNIGNRMAGWFTAEFGSTQCRDTTGADLASAADVRRFLADGGVEKCRAITEKVAGKTEEILSRTSVHDVLPARGRYRQRHQAVLSADAATA